jgi:hypothetical protein
LLVLCDASPPIRTANRSPEGQRRTPSTPQKVSLSPSYGSTTLTLWSIFERLLQYAQNFELGLHKPSKAL